MYWSTNPLLQGSVFSSAMSRDRYFNILKCIHFANNENYESKDPNRDRLFKICSIVELLVERFFNCNVIKFSCVKQHNLCIFVP